jgi:amino acid permease
MSIKKKVLQATLAMLGTIIGAGVFAIPSVFRQFGLIGGTAIYWIVAALVLATHLLMMEVVIRQKAGKMRLPGHVGVVLGKPWSIIAFASHPGQTIGACLAYIILGGEFLYAIGGMRLVPSILFWQGIFWLGGALTVIVGMKLVAKVESVLTWLLLAALLISSIIFFRQADPTLFFAWQGSWAWSPLGILIFSLFGLTVIPEIVELSGGKREQASIAITLGSLCAAICMWIFGVMAYAAAPDAAASAAGYASVMPAASRWIIPCVGFLAVATSFITLMEGLKNMLSFDAKLHKHTALAIALASPVILLLLTKRNFLNTVSFVGGVFSALNGAFATVMAAKLLKKTWPLVITSIFLLILLSRILSLT